MKENSNFVQRFIQFCFSEKIENAENIIDIDEVNIVDVNETPPEKQGKIHTPYVSESQTKIQIVTQINRLLMAVCLLSFLFTIIYPFIHPDKPIPDLIPNTFFTTLGWFGGILGAFFKFDQNSK